MHKGLIALIVVGVAGAAAYFMFGRKASAADNAKRDRDGNIIPTPNYGWATREDLEYVGSLPTFNSLSGGEQERIKQAFGTSGTQTSPWGTSDGWHNEYSLTPPPAAHSENPPIQKRPPPPPVVNPYGGPKWGNV